MEQITRYDVVLVIIALFTFIILIIKFLMPLIKTLTQLAYAVDMLEKHCSKAEDTNVTEHKEIKEHIAATDLTVAEHGTMLQAHEHILNDVLTNHTQ